MVNSSLPENPTTEQKTRKQHCTMFYKDVIQESGSTSTPLANKDMSSEEIMYTDPFALPSAVFKNNAKPDGMDATERKRFNAIWDSVKAKTSILSTQSLDSSLFSHYLIKLLGVLKEYVTSADVFADIFDNMLFGSCTGGFGHFALARGKNGCLY